MRRHEGEKNKQCKGRKEDRGRGGEQWKWVVKAVGFGLDLPSAKGMTDWILLACIFEQRRRM